MSQTVYGNKPAISPADIDKMREIVLQHDRGSINQFDLNNPPKQPYKHQEFPKMVYDHSKAEPAKDVVKKTRDGEELVHVPAKHGHKVVHNDQELKAALAEGFSEEPPDFSAEAGEEAVAPSKPKGKKKEPALQ